MGSDRKICGRRNGFTLIELIMVIVILGVLSAAGTHLTFYLVKNAIFVPNKLNMDMLASDALDIIVDGDGLAKGLRFSKSITAVQDYQVNFNNQDGQSVVYRLDTGTNKLYRSLNGGTEVVIPYYAAAAGVSVAGNNNKLFIYYDANEAVTAVPAAVRWVTITLNAKTGTGSYDNWQGQSQQSTSIAVNKFQ